MALVDFLRPSRRSQSAIPPVNLPTLPPELWMVVAELIDPAELEKLIGVNRAFFDIVMDNRYREVKLIDLDPVDLFRKVDALKNNNLACRVQILKIWPMVVWDAIQAEPKPLKPPPRPLLVERTTFFQTPRRRLRRTNEAPITPSPPLFTDTPMSVEDKHAMVLDTIKRLSNVRELHLYWRRHHTSSTANYHVWPLLAQTWPAIGPRLCSLFLDMPLAILAAFFNSFAPATGPANLRQLEIVFSVDQSSVEKTEDGINTLLSFIHDHSNTLESLSITTYGHVDLSPFFRRLGSLPHLTTLSFTIPFDDQHISNPSTFNEVLINHPNLHSLAIQNRYSNCCGTWQLPATTDGASGRWVHQCFEGINFAQLKEFKLGVNYLYEIQQHMMLAMKPICFALSSLILTEPCLKWNGLTVVLRSLHPRHLKALSLFVDVLNAAVVDLLAECCPSLHHLALSIETVGAWNGSHDRNTFRQEEETFIESMRNRSSRSRELHIAWKLRNLEIWRWVYEAGRQRQWSLTRALAEFIPTIESFSEEEVAGIS